MIDEREKTIGIIESAAVELKNLLDIAQTFTDGKSDNTDIKEIDFCLSKRKSIFLNLTTFLKTGILKNSLITDL